MMKKFIFLFLLIGSLFATAITGNSYTAQTTWTSISGNQNDNFSATNPETSVGITGNSYTAVAGPLYYDIPQVYSRTPESGSNLYSSYLLTCHARDYDGLSTISIYSGSTLLSSSSVTGYENSASYLANLAPSTSLSWYCIVCDVHHICNTTESWMVAYSPGSTDTDTETKQTKERIPLSISRLCPDNKIEVSAPSGSSITIMYPGNIRSESERVGSEGKVYFSVNMEGEYTVLGSSNDYSADEKKFDFTFCKSQIRFTMQPMEEKCPYERYKLTFSADGKELTGYSFSITDSSGRTLWTAQDANSPVYIIPFTTSGTYQIQASKSGYNSLQSNLTVKLECDEKKEDEIDEKPEEPLTPDTPQTSGTTTDSGSTSGQSSVSGNVTTKKPDIMQETYSKSKSEQPDQDIKKSSGFLNDVIADILSSNEKKASILVILAIGGLLAYKFLLHRKKPVAKKKKDPDETSKEL